MELYKHILVPIDLSDESQKLITRALAIAAKLNARTSLIHVVEHTTGYGYGDDSWGVGEESDIQVRILQHATSRLKEAGEKNGISEDDCHLRQGDPKIHIHELAKEIGSDLILIGSHGRQGIRLLLGSTANAVLHGATCDVLAVRM